MPVLGVQGSTKGAPSAPIIGTATVTNATTVSVTFTAPSFSKLPITSYTATSSPSIALSTSGSSSPVAVTGSFASGTTYTFTISAVNSNATSLASSSSNSSTPNPSYYIAALSDPLVSYGRPQTGLGITVDPSGNVYTVGWRETASTGDNCYISKSDSSGSAIWSKEFYNGTRHERFNSVTTDFSGNVYIGGYQDMSSQNTFMLTKIDSSGSLQWQRNFATAGAGVKGVHTDASGNVYATCSEQWTGASYTQFVKYNSAGTLQYQKKWGGGTGLTANLIKSDKDSSDNLYAIGDSYQYSGAGYQDVVFGKFDSSAAVQWQRNLTAGVSLNAGGITVDSSGNVFVGVTQLIGTAYAMVLLKYNSSGTLQWQRKLLGDNGYAGLGLYGLDTDSSGNLYFVGHNGASGTNDIFVGKYNTSGSIQWQRTMASTGNDRGYSILVDSTGNINIVGNSDAIPNGGGDIFYAKLPNDGSKTGTYSIGGASFVYAASTLAESANTTITSSTSSMSVATTSMDENMTAFSSLNPSYTARVTTL